MAREARAIQSEANLHLPKTVSRQGSTRRDQLISRMRAMRRMILALSFAAGALFTGLALRHSPQSSTSTNLPSAGSASQVQSSANQPGNVPSQSLFGNGSSDGFSVAPAPQVSSSHVRTVSS